MNGLCDGRRRRGLSCTAPAVFMVGVFETGVGQYRTACEAHLGKVIRWQITRLAIADGIVAVALIRRSAPPT